jgi:hypothetical protein
MMRDPRLDPRPGDWLTDENWCVRVDRVRDGEVLVAGFPREGSPATASVLLSEWAEATAGAAVMVLAEDDPAHGRTVIE